MGKLAAAAAMGLSLASGSALASTVFSSQVGDADGFGIGITTPGETFFAVNVLDFGSPDLNGTDEFIDITSVTHTYAFSGTILSATLTLFHGGWGATERAKVFFNGAPIGELSDGEVGDDNFARYDSFDLFGLLGLASNPGLLTGSDTIEIVSTKPTPSSFDDGVLDFSLLTITTDAGGGTAIPEPGTWALSALALAGLAASRRRRR